MASPEGWASAFASAWHGSELSSKMRLKPAAMEDCSPEVKNPPSLQLESAADVIAGLAFVDVPDVSAIADAFREHLWGSRRFCSVFAGGAWSDRREDTMDVSYHITELACSDEAALLAWARAAALEPLDATRPPWRVSVLRAPKPSRSAVLVRIHRCVAEGAGEAGDELRRLEAALDESPAHQSTGRGGARETSAASPEKAEKPDARSRRTRRSRSRSQKGTMSRVQSRASVGSSKRSPCTWDGTDLSTETRQVLEETRNLHSIDSNRRGGGGGQAYKEQYEALANAAKALPELLRESVEERLAHMIRVYKSNSPGTYRSVCEDIAVRLRTSG